MACGVNYGGGKGVRTPDPETASLVLSQLSYAPIGDFVILLNDIRFILKNHLVFLRKTSQNEKECVSAVYRKTICIVIIT